MKKMEWMAVTGTLAALLAGKAGVVPAMLLAALVLFLTSFFYDQKHKP